MYYTVRGAPLSPQTGQKMGIGIPYTFSCSILSPHDGFVNSFRRLFPKKNANYVSFTTDGHRPDAKVRSSDAKTLDICLKCGALCLVGDVCAQLYRVHQVKAEYSHDRFGIYYVSA